MAEQDVLDLIKKYESGGRNVPNYMYSDTPDESGLKHTAQGYYQITNTNWKDYGPEVGVDLTKYPAAMDAPEDVQRKVADHLLNKTPLGVRNWTDNNPQLRAALSDQGVQIMPQEQVDYGSMTDEQLRELVRKDKDLSKRMVPETPVPKTDTTKKGDTTKKTIIVKPPDKGWGQKIEESLQKWAESPTTTPEQSFWTGSSHLVPGAKQIVRGIVEPGGDWRSHTADIIEGGGRVATPIGIGALLGLTAGAAAPELAAGDVLGATGAAARATVPFIKGAGWGTLGYGAGQLVSQDPATRRVASDIGGLAGATFGPKISLPGGRIAPALIRMGGRMLPIPGAHTVGDLISDWMLSGKGGGAPPTGPVEPPTAAPGKPLPRTTVEDDMVRTGSLTTDQYIQRMKDMGMAEDTARAKLAHAQKTGAETNARTAGNRGRNQQGPVTITPTEEQLRSSTNPQGPVTVNIPPGLKVQTTAPPTGPVSPPPGGTAAMAPQNFPPQAPVPPPAPGSLGTVGPLGPTPQGPPLQGPAPTGTPISPPLGQPPVQPPVTPTRPAVPTSTLDLPVRPPGEIPRPVTPPTGPVPTRTPTGTMPPTDFERSSQEVYRIARKLGQAPPITSNKLTLTRWQKLLGFLPTRDQMIEGRRLYHDWVKSGRPTATNPTDADLK